MAEAPPRIDLAADDAASTAPEPPPAASDEPLPDPGRLASLLQRLSEIAGDGQAAVNRLSFTRAERDAHDALARWMAEAGLAVETDAFGNTSGTRAGRRSDLPPIAFGSHLDSVPQGGRFDGAVGVVAGVEVLRLLDAAGVQTEHPLRLIAFACEEGARFGEACLGSKAVVGLLQPGDLQRLRDAQGVTLAAAMQALDLDPRQLPSVRWEPRALAAFLELHIEQGRLLENDGKAVGLVEAVAGNTRLRIGLQGRADHSGGTPMHIRKDALAAAAEMVLGVEVNVVPEEVSFSVDLRHSDEGTKQRLLGAILARCETIARERGLTLVSKVTQESRPSQMDAALGAVLVQAAQTCGASWKAMPSGAGHDSQEMARHLPTAMLFVPSHQGLSHCPEEWTSISDVAVGVRVLYHSILALDRSLIEQAA